MGLGQHRDRTRQVAAPQDAVDALLRLHHYAALPAMLADRVVPADITPLINTGRALMELDLYGFETDGLPNDIAQDVHTLRWPTSPNGEPRGPMLDIAPLFRHMLAVMEVSVTRGDTTGTLSAIHLAAEYLPWLAWQHVGGHAGDPARMVRLADPSAAWHDTRCPLDRQDRQAFTAALLATRDAAHWDAYVRDSHSRVASALTVCGGVPVPQSSDSSPRVCRAPCGVVDGMELGWPMTLVRRFQASALLDLRHDSPVGHFFAVPDEKDVSRAWERTLAGLREHHTEAPGGDNPLVHAEHGLPSLFAVVAGQQAAMTAGDLLERVSERIRVGLRSR